MSTDTVTIERQRGRTAADWLIWAGGAAAAIKGRADSANPYDPQTEADAWDLWAEGFTERLAAGRDAA